LLFVQGQLVYGHDGALCAVKPDDKEDNTVTADIPESVFEEALRAVEKIQAETRAAGGPRHTAADKPGDLSELMELLGGHDEKAAPAGPVQPTPSNAELESDLQMLSKLLEEEYNLEKEADFFKSVLFTDLQSPEKPIDESIVKQKEGQIQELMNRLTNLQAEFEKFRQRLTKEAEAAKRFGNETLILNLLPILDNLERAIAHADSSEDKKAMVQGVRLIYKQLLDGLVNFGVKLIEAKGRTFDPNYHDAITTIETTEVAANLVVSEYQKGYLLFDRLIRPARVVVSRMPAEKAGAPEASAPPGADEPEAKTGTASDV
jgi:molecular chaperone GrpE